MLRRTACPSSSRPARRRGVRLAIACHHSGMGGSSRIANALRSSTSAAAALQPASPVSISTAAAARPLRLARPIEHEGLGARRHRRALRAVVGSEQRRCASEPRDGARVRALPSRTPVPRRLGSRRRRRRGVAGHSRVRAMARPGRGKGKIPGSGQTSSSLTLSLSLSLSTYI